MSDTQELNPATGLPYSTQPGATAEKDLNPATGMPYGGERTLVTAGSGLDIRKEPLSNYKKYGISLVPGDWDDRRARRQSTGEKWAHGLAKAAVTTVGAVVENTAGALDGIFEATATQDATKLYDNHVGRAVDRTNKWMQENFPNYATEYEQKQEGFAAMGYANFWADKVANGIGYSVGSIGTMYLTGGVGLIGKAANVLGKASKASKMLKAAKLIDGSTDVVEALGKGSNLAQRAGNALRATEVGLMMSYGESSVEAREVLHSTTTSLLEQYAQEDGVDVNQLSPERVADAKDRAASAGNAAWAANMAVTSATNLATFGRAVFAKYPVAKPRAKHFSMGAKGKYIDDLAEMSPTRRALTRYGVEPVKNTISESLQEGAQYAISSGSEQYAKGDRTIGNWASAMYEGAQETWASKEGRESMLIGGIVGLLTGGFGSVKSAFEAGAVDAQRAETLGMLNNPAILRTVAAGQHSQANMNSLRQAASALEAGDHKGYRDAMGKAQMHEVLSHLSRGTVDMYKEKIDYEITNMPEAEARKKLGIPEGVEFNAKEAAERMKKSADEIVALSERVNAQFPTPMTTQGAARLAMSNQSKLAEQAEVEDVNYLRHLALTAGYAQEDGDSRVEKLVNEVNIADPKANLKLEDFKASNALDGPIGEVVAIDADGKTTRRTGQLRKELVDQLQESADRLQSTDPLLYQEIKNKIVDLAALTTDRAHAVAALNQLYGSPQERDAYKSRELLKERAEVRATADRDFRNRAKTMYSESQLDDAIEEAKIQQSQGNLSQEVVDELIAQRQGIQKKYDQTEERLRKMSTDEIQVLMESEEDPVILELMAEHLSRRVKSGEFTAVDEDVETINDSEEGNEQADEIRNDEVTGTPEEAATPSGSRDGLKGLSIASGEFEITGVSGEKRIVVGINGNPNEGNDAKDPVYGPQLEEGKKLHRQNLIGSDVTFRILEDHSLAKVAEDSGDIEGRTPIGVYTEGQLIGLLNVDTPARKAIYRRAKEEGEVKGNIASQMFGNPTNMVDAEGNRVFSSIDQIVSKEDIQNGDAAIAVLRQRTNDAGVAEVYWDLGDISEGNLAELEKGAAEYLDRGDNKQKTRVGEAGLVVKDPVGGITVLKLSTQTLGTSGRAMGLAKAALKENNIEKLREIVGLPVMLSPGIKLMVDESGIITYAVPGETDLFAQTTVEAYGTNDGSAMTLGKLVLDENNAYQFQATEMPTEQRGPIEGKFQQDIEMNLSESRFQINAGKINSPTTERVSPLDEEKFYDSYLDYLSSVPDTLDDRSILSGDFRKVNDSLYFDVGFEFSVKPKADGTTSETTNVPVSEASKFTATYEQEQAELDRLSAELFTEEQRTDVVNQFMKDAAEVAAAVAAAAPKAPKKAKKKGKKKSKKGKHKLAGVLAPTKTTEEKTPATPKEAAKGVEEILENPAKQSAADRIREFFSLDPSKLKSNSQIKQEVKEEFEKIYRERVFSIDGKEYKIDTDLRTIDVEADVEVSYSSEISEKARALREQSIKKEIDELPPVFRLAAETDVKIDPAKAKKWLSDRFGDDSVRVFDQLQKVGDSTVHGYMQNAAVHLYSQAEIGTEYHEAFHLFFRNFATDSQRVSMYEESAQEFGEPTAKEIAAARRGQTDLTKAEARLLALEERMAEQFRDYTLLEQDPKTLGAKVLKFFKDLLAYIKAVATNRLAVRQAFRLIESNRIPAKLSRKADKFAPSTAYLMEEFSNRPEARNELTDIAILKLITDLDALADSDQDSKNTEVGNMMGSRDGSKGSSIRNWFLRNAVNKGGNTLTDEEFSEFKKLYDDGEFDAIGNLGLSFGPASKQSGGEAMPGQMLETDEDGFSLASSDFLEVYDQWFDEKSEVTAGVYNTARGFRTEVIERIGVYGYAVVDATQTEEVTIDETEGEERIYSVARLQESPSKKMSDRAKRLLARIPIQDKTQEASIYGFQTFVPVQEALRVIASTVDGAPSLHEMKRKLSERTDKVNILRNAREFLDGLDAQAQATFYSNFALSTNNFILPLTKMNTQGRMETKMISPNANSARVFWTKKWKAQLTETSDGPYTVVRSRGQEIARSTNPEVKKALEANMEIINDKKSSDGSKQKALADILMDLGIEVADTREQAVDRIQSLFSNYPKQFPSVEVVMRSRTGLLGIVNHFLEGGEGRNIFETSDATLSYFARQVRERYDGPQGTSFLGGDLKTYYPLNLRSQLNEYSHMVKSGELGARFRGKYGFERGKGKNKVTSVLVKLLNNEKFKNDFQVQDLNVAKIERAGDKETREYENLTYEQSLAIRLNMYGNIQEGKPSNMGMYSLDTPGDRKRFTFEGGVKFTNTQSREKYGIVRDNVGTVVRDMVLLDLERMARAIEVIASRDEANMIDGYHYRIDKQTGERDYERGGWKVFNVPGVSADITLESKLPFGVRSKLANGKALSDEMIAEVDNMGKQADMYLEEAYLDHLNEIGSIDAAVKMVRDNVDHRLYTKGKEIDFLKAYSIDEILNRTLHRQKYRSGMNYVKDGVDYIKRATIIGTPGRVLLQKGDIESDQTYGMMPTFNEATIEDIITSLPEDQIKSLGKVIGKSLGNQKAGADIANTYGRLETTDAQGLISPDMYRSMLEGLGEWSPEMSKAFDSFKAGGRWNYKVLPTTLMKPFMGMHNEIDGHMVPFADKNSYLVLTPDVVKGTPTLQRIYDRMTLKDMDPNIHEPIHVVNVKTAKKLGSRPPFDSSQDLSDILITKMDSRGLRIPQDMPSKREDKTNLGRQPRKNMVANIDNKGQYELGDTKMLGSDLKSWYHNAIIRKMRLNKAKVLAKYGGEEAILNPMAGMSPDMKRAIINKVMPAVRDQVMDMARERGLSENQAKMLDLEVRDGIITPVIPFAFPAMSTRFGNLVLSVFRKEVYRQKMKGFEAVQFSDFTREEDDGLKFLTVDEGGNKIVAAEVAVTTKTLRKLGINPNQSLEEVNLELREILGYRIPQQGKSSMLLMQIKYLLPDGYKGSIRVPAGITNQMGSDFDIDKMFLLFPETKDGKKITPDYSQDPSSTELMSEPEVNNIIFDTFKAVAQSPTHAAESLSPLMIDDLEKAREEMGMGKQAIDIYKTSTPIRTSMANMLSNALRGQHANAIAARNVLESAGVPVILGEYGIAEITSGDTTVTKLDYQTKLPDAYGVKRPSDYYLSQLLSAAVDSVKDPIQDSLNITSKTAGIWHLMIDAGLRPVDITPFITNPNVRDITDRMLKEDMPANSQSVAEAASSLGLAMDSMEDVRAVEIDLDMALGGAKTIGELGRLMDAASRYAALGRAVNIDNIDQAGTIPQHLAKLDAVDSTPMASVITTGEVGERSKYPYIAEYYNSIVESLNFMTNLGFPALQEGLQDFKKNAMRITNVAPTDRAHRDLERIASYYIATMPGSALYESGLLDKAVVEETMLDPDLNIVKKFGDLKKRFPSNALLQNLQPKITMRPDDMGMIHALELQGNIDRTETQVNDIDQAWYEMLYGDNAELEKFGKDLITNLIVSTGFTPGPTSLFEHIPTQFIQDLGVSDHMQNRVVAKDMAALKNITATEFRAHFGHHMIGGRRALKNIFGVNNPESGVVSLAAEDADAVVIDNSVFFKVSDPVFDQDRSLSKASVYRRSNTFGRQGAFYEMNIRGAEGKSLIHRTEYGPDESRLMPKQFTQRANPKSVDSQIAKLQTAFQKAGVDVTVEFGTLAAGVKGSVAGNVITLDRDQLTADTAYHEFGHILVDRLPIDQVMRDAAQIEALRPELAMSVRAQYPNLNAEQMAKEILVTAIGFEGAKIERKNPSAIQRIINKILRAIGKIFGITPNAAAVLAEELFAGEIRASISQGEFNPMVQLSKAIDERLDQVAEEARTSLKREIARIKAQGDKASKSDVALIKDLTKKFENVEDIGNEIRAFTGFQRFATIQEAKAKELHDKILQYKDRSLSKEEARALLNEANELKYILDGLFSTKDENSTISNIRRVLNEQYKSGELTTDDTNDLYRIYTKLGDTLENLRYINADWATNVAPLVVDSLFQLGEGDAVNTELEQQIQSLEKGLEDGVYDTSGTSMIGTVFTRDPNIKAVRARKNAIVAELGNDGYRRELVKAKIETLKNKRVGRKELINELTQAHTQKSFFSLMADPLVYSNENNLQLFVNAVRSARMNGNRRATDLIRESESVYKAIVAFKGQENNVAKLNEDVLTTFVNPTNGVEVLAIVQEVDSKKWYDAFAETERKAKKKYGHPGSKDMAKLQAWKYGEDGKISVKYKGYIAEMKRWEAANTEERPDAMKLYNALNSEITKMEDKLKFFEERMAVDMIEKGWSPLDTDIAILEAELNELRSEKSKSFDDISGRFIGPLAVPKLYAENGDRLYASEKYEKIQSTPELKAYYDYITSTYAAQQKMISGKSRMYMDPWNKEMSYAMPAIRKEDYDRMSENGVIGTIKDAIAEGFTRQDTDIQFGGVVDNTGKQIKSIPVYYTNSISHVDASKDVMSSILQFGHMAYQYEEKGKLHGLVNAMMNLHEQRQVIQEQGGIPMVDYIKSGVTKAEEYITQSLEGEDRTYQHLSDFVDKVFYGRFEVTGAAVGGLSGQKVADRAIQLTALNSLAFNFLQMGNQAVLDNLMAGMEAGVGEFFSRANRREAFKIYFREGAALQELGAFAKKSKLSQAREMFDAGTDITDEIGKNVTGNKAKKTAQGNILFAGQSAVEHQVTSVKMIAVMQATKDFVDKDGNKIEGNLWDNLIMDENGKLIVNPKIANFNVNAFTNKLAGINRRTNQVKGDIDAASATSKVWGKLLFLFKNYFVPFYRRRVGHGEDYHNDLEIGTVTRGYYTTFFGFLRNAALNSGQVTKLYGNLSPIDKRNMKRAGLEMAYIVSSMAIFSLLKGMSDDDEDNYFAAFGAYQARRLQTELTALLNPAEFIRMFKAPMATANHVEKYWDLIDQFMFKEVPYLFGIGEEEDIFMQRSSSWAEKGQRKIVGDLKRVTGPVNGYQTTKTKNVRDRIRFFDE